MIRALMPIALTVSMGCSDYEVYSLESADIFYQLEASEVDILLVVDNSCSMQPYQNKLAASFDSFLTYFIEGDVDYQIGVTTTSLQEVEYNPAYNKDCPQQVVDAIPAPGALVDGIILTPDTPNPDSTFSDIVNVGICGAGYEMGLGSARLALQHAGSGVYNDGFLRDEAYLSIIFVSDEQDGSPLPVNDYINEFRDSKSGGGRESVIASALVVENTNACNPEQQEYATVGSRYIDVAEQTGGLIGNICGDDFESIVTELSLNSSRLTDTFYLSALPEPGSLLVGVSNSGDVYEIDCDTGEWTYELQEDGDEVLGVIVFDRAYMPPPNSKITVKYDRGDGDPASFCGSDTTDSVVE
ncbi:MAG: hypothetical protein ACI8RZ_006448 [Myxococcota bacterium]|jgi:hypothetical protein